MSGAGSRRFHVSPWALAVLVASPLGAAACFAFGSPDDVATAAAVTWLILPAMAFPLFTRRGVAAVANPWTVIFGLFVYCWTIRLTLTAFQGSGSVAFRTMFYGSDPEIIFDGLFLGGIGLAAFAAGYLLIIGTPKPRVPKARFVRWHRLDDQRAWSPRLMEFLGVTVLLVSLVGFFLLQRSGGDTGESFSAKRFNELEGGSANRTSSLAYVYLRIAYLSHAVFIMLLVYRLKFRRLPSPLLRVLLPLSGAAALIVPFSGSNRAGVALILVDLLLLQVLLSGRIRLGRLAVGVTVATGLVAWMFALRDPVAGRTFGEGVLSTFTGRDMFDIGKLAHIANSPPGELNGQTLWGWLVFPFPEQALPFEKPVWTALGNYVFGEVYHGPSDITGIPAGLIGELYLNLGLPAVIAGMALFGVLVAAIYKMVFPLASGGRIIGAVLFAIALVRLVMFGLSGDLGTGILSSLSDLLPILALLAVAAPRRRWLPDDEPGGRLKDSGSSAAGTARART